MLADCMRRAASGVGGGIIKSIQQVAVTISNGNSSATATIASVDTSKTILVWNGRSDSSSSTAHPLGATWSCVATLTNATTVTVTRPGTSNTVTVYLTVVEFVPSAVNSVQYGTVSLTGSSSTSTITSVNTSTSVCLYLGHYLVGGGSPGSIPLATARVELTNATTVTATRGASGDGATYAVAYCVVEFSASVISSVQKVLLSGSNAFNVTITSVDTARSMLFWGGITTGVNTDMGYLSTAEISNSTTVRCEGSSIKDISVTVVQFAPGVIKSIQRNRTTITTVNPLDTTITAVNVNKSFVNWLGQVTNSNTDTQADRYLVGNKLQSSTVMRLLRGGTSGGQNVSWEVVEFS